MGMTERSKLALYYFIGAIVLFAVGYGLAWFSDQPLFSKEVFPKHVATNAPSSAAPSATPAEGSDKASAKPGRQYTVQSGDTISSIAEANGITYQQLADYNGIPYPYNLTVGQIIVIPQVR